MRRVLVLHGPSLSHLGRREPTVYGHETLEALNHRVTAHGASLGLHVTCLQSNHEGDIIDALLADLGDAVVINAGAWAHTSLAIADAIRAIAPLPVIEVHLSNTTAREPARQVSLVGAACRGRIEGFGGDSYLLALDAVARWFAPKGD